VEPAAWAGVFRHGRDLFTANSTPGYRVYGEALRTEGAVEYRAWDPFRSKLAGFLLKGAPADLLAGVRAVLYLGGAHGTTVSHLSDVLPRATISVIEKSPTAFAPLLALARRRENVLPYLADAQLPERYAAEVGPVDLVYQDVAQRNQASIFVENARTCLAPGGRGILMLKVRSVTQRKPSAAVASAARRELGAAGCRIFAEAELAPFARDHLAFAVRT
jgi:fibrillarin-like pre-rRNA processing protein